MSTTHLKTASWSACGLVALLLCTGLTKPGRAGNIPVLLATEVMIEDEATNDALLIATRFGVDASSPLHFTSIVATNGQYFSYSLDSGSMYQGTPISLTGLGTLSGSTWTISSSGSLGPMGSATAWSTLGTTAITYNAAVGSDTDKADADWMDKDGKKIGDVHSDSTSKPSSDGGYDVMDTTYRTDKNGKKVPGSDMKTNDKISATGDWNMQAVGPIGITSSGFSPPNGGVGSFTVGIVPEPPSAILLLLGAPLVGACRRKKRPRNSEAAVVLATTPAYGDGE